MLHASLILSQCYVYRGCLMIDFELSVVRSLLILDAQPK